MVTNEAKNALAAIGDLDAVLDRIAMLPLPALTTRQKSALLAQLEAVRLVLSAVMISAAGVPCRDRHASESARVRKCAAS
ncbi:hypothetical protein MSM1_05485 [Mycobacterium sp. SM1]|uniref:hypothetical protein n=1 Tax=Mycobacterium sp. SM1 TaxID=2816243 RepID=UPI001BD08910|nr:hypothetical protein [Mycobacterium sp. SM1]MBS4727820.1 hypothetical protein [Mycobacterium sp. SM1]